MNAVEKQLVKLRQEFPAWTFTYTRGADVPWSAKFSGHEQLPKGIKVSAMVLGANSSASLALSVRTVDAFAGGLFAIKASLEAQRA